MSRREGCLSDLQLDLLLGGALAGGEEGRAREHLSTCAGCTARYDELHADREAFQTAMPPLELRAPEPPRRLAPRRAAWVGSAMALAASVALVVLVGRPSREGIEVGQTKGTGWSGFYVRHQGVVREGGPGEVVRPGDALQFTTSLTAPGFVAVLSVDGARRASLYYPAEPTAAPQPAGEDVPLPLSTLLDDTLGPETVYVLACPAPILLDPLVVALEREPSRPPPAEGCDVDVVELDKQEGP
ncbi:hypothetical protein [Archangium violaceum]|uniref:hypothetical protein n=1 Tax=Archangium violaceum TaxID=83451 RepID=UPI0036DE3198